jgi:hypothetical protein
MMPRPRDITVNQEKTVCRLFDMTHMTYAVIAEEVGVSVKQVHDAVHRNYPQERIAKRKAVSYRNSKIGAKNPSFARSGSEAFHWEGGEPVADGKGYLIVPKPDWYTGRRGSKYVFMHSVVMCELLGLTEIPAGFVVHHVDGNRLNNDPSNLALMTNAAHSRLHALERVETIPQGSRD